MEALIGIKQDWLQKDSLKWNRSIIMRNLWPIVKPTTIHLILTVTISLKSPILQMDVKNVFLYDDLKNKLYGETSRIYRSVETIIHVSPLKVFLRPKVGTKSMV